MSHTTSCHTHESPAIVMHTHIHVSHVTQMGHITHTTSCHTRQQSADTCHRDAYMYVDRVTQMSHVTRVSYVTHMSHVAHMIWCPTHESCHTCHTNVWLKNSNYDAYIHLSHVTENKSCHACESFYTHMMITCHAHESCHTCHTNASHNTRHHNAYKYVSHVTHISHVTHNTCNLSLARLQLRLSQLIRKILQIFSKHHVSIQCAIENDCIAVSWEFLLQLRLGQLIRGLPQKISSILKTSALHSTCYRKRQLSCILRISSFNMISLSVVFRKYPPKFSKHQLANQRAIENE